MTGRSTPAAWSPAQRGLHWLGAVLVLIGFGLGWWMVALPFRALVLKFALYQAHKTIGLVVLVITLARLGLRWRCVRPPWPEDITAWSRHAAAFGHVLLYALLLIVPALGFLTAASAPIGVPTLLFGVIPLAHPLAPDLAVFAVLQPVHRTLALLLVGLAAGHTGMALWHRRNGTQVLRRMWRPGRDEN
jgi:cytochrome b561